MADRDEWRRRQLREKEAPEVFTKSALEAIMWLSQAERQIAQALAEQARASSPEKGLPGREWAMKEAFSSAASGLASIVASLSQEGSLRDVARSYDLEEIVRALNEAK